MRCIAGFFIALFVAGCPASNTLTGSISQSHDLSFDTVALKLLTGQLAYELKYLLPLEGGGEDVVAKIVFNQPAGGVVVDQEIDLVAVAGRVERVTAANDPFPAGLTTAQATFSVGGNEGGESTAGKFAATFDNGKTLNGSFETVLEIVDF